ncbi:MAG: hypothetical protein GKR89_25885 [Candidatus Latescibacteria bacterium]|nr:hypothetical protein [Candidatus Latescibacterota bacterium]
MEYRLLGDSQLRVSSIVLGTAFRGELVAEMPRVIDRALDLGINIFDTGGYIRKGVVTEEVVGRVVKGRRQDVVLAVKQDPPLTQDLETRLARLQTDYIDLLELLPCRCHAVCNSGYEGYEEAPHYSAGDAMERAERLVQQGVVRYIGVSRYTTAQLEESTAAATGSKVLSNQIHYNLVQRDLGDEVRSYCAANKIAIMGFSPLGAGLFAGTDRAANEFLYDRYGLDTPAKLAAYRVLIETLGQIGRQRGKSVAQVAINWLLCQEIALPIIGPDTVTHLEENCGAVGWRLAAGELEQIDQAVSSLVV